MDRSDLSAGLTNEHDLLNTGSKKDFVSEGLYSAAYSGLQSPLSAVAQIIDNGAGTKLEEKTDFLPPPEPAEFGSMNWHAQQIGAVAGMMVPFLMVAKGTGMAADRVLPADTRRIAACGSLFSRQNRRLVAESAVAGFTYDSLLRRVTPEEMSSGFWSARVKHGVTGAATFAALGSSAVWLKHTGALSFTGRAENALSAAVAGVPSGLVCAEASSLLDGRGMASLAEVGQAAYTMSMVGGILGAAHTRVSGSPERRALPQLDSQSKGAQSENANRVETPARVKRSTDALPERINDRAYAAGRILPEEALSMRELAKRGDESAVRTMMDKYFPELEKAFPLEGEIETPQTYLEYLRDPQSTWDMVVLRDKQHQVLGGIQYQILDVHGQSVKKVAWAEHIWVKQENRNYDNFRALLKVAESQIKQGGSNLVFMEFNNPRKMSAAEMATDAEGGITTQDRAKIWGRVGINVALDSRGEIVEYAQPSMNGQPPVRYLSLGFIGIEPLSGKRLPVSDYLAVAHAAHKTIPGVDLNTDPTVRFYTEQILKSGDTQLTFKPLWEVMARKPKPGQ